MAKGGASCGFFLRCAPWSGPKHWNALSRGWKSWPINRRQITWLHEHRSPGSHNALTRWLHAPRRRATRSRRLIWFVDGDKAWLRETPEQVITWAELEARPTARIVIRYVHADNGRPAACCSGGGACYAVHGPTNSV